MVHKEFQLAAARPSIPHPSSTSFLALLRVWFVTWLVGWLITTVCRLGRCLIEWLADLLVAWSVDTLMRAVHVCVVDITSHMVMLVGWVGLDRLLNGRRLIGWVGGFLVWLVGYMANGRLIGWLNNIMINRLVGWLNLVGWLVYRSVAWVFMHWWNIWWLRLNGWLSCWPIDWLIGWLVAELIGCLTVFWLVEYRLVDWTIGDRSWMLDWLSGWLFDWSSGWLVGC